MAEWAVEYLIILSQNEEVGKILDNYRIGGLNKASIGEGSGEISPRHYQLAKHFFPIAFTHRLDSLIQAPYGKFVIQLVNNVLATVVGLELPKEPKPNSNSATERREIKMQLSLPS